MPPTIDVTQFRMQDTSSDKRRAMGVYTGPASYATGGDAAAPGYFSLGQLHVLFFEQATNGTVILLLKYDYTAQKVKWFDMAGAEIAAATNLSTYTARFEAIGL